MATGPRSRRRRCRARAREPAVAPSRSWWLSFAVAPFVVYPVFLMKALCFALFACAFNLLIGYVGLLSFGHAVFLGSAGYVDRARREGLGLATRAAILAGVAAAAVLGPRHRRPRHPAQGIYFAMITLALAQMVYFFCLQAPFTGGEDGIQAVPRGRAPRACSTSTTPCTLYFVVLASSSPGSSSSTAPSTRRSVRC